MERRVLGILVSGRPKGAKNRRPVGEEFAKKAALLRADARLARRVPYDLDSNEKLDPMQVLEEAMRHFYRKAIMLLLPSFSHASNVLLLPCPPTPPD